MDNPLFIFKPEEKREIEERLKRGEVIQLEPIRTIADYSKLVVSPPILTFNKEHENRLVEQYKLIF